MCAGSAFSQGEENRLHLGTGSAGGRRKSIQGRGQIAQTLQTLHFLLPTHAAAHQHHHRNTDALVGRSVQQETCAGLAPASCEHLRLALAHTATCTAATVPEKGKTVRRSHSVVPLHVSSPFVRLFALRPMQPSSVHSGDLQPYPQTIPSSSGLI